MSTIPRIKDRNLFDDDFYLQNHRRQGSDPVVQSKSSKIYNRTVWLAEKIDREMKVREGAEKLLRAANNKSIQNEISLELRKVNSNIQTMKEEIVDLISEVGIHQSKETGLKSLSPMIPIGLKETNFVDYSIALKDFLVDHYHDDPDLYRFELNCLTELRKACCQPMKNEDKLEINFAYYNQLYFVDRRFFLPNSNGPVLYDWYDALTGMIATQKTVGFEKGSVLFNIAVLFAQKASKVKWKEALDLDEAVEDFRKAAGAFQYLRDNFLHAPSVDMQMTSTVLLTQLMMSQAFECQLEKHLIRTQNDGRNRTEENVELAQEASMVSSMFSKALSMMSNSILKDDVPHPWIALSTCKKHCHLALAHYHIALAFISADATNVTRCTGAHAKIDIKQKNSYYPDKMAEDEDGRKTLAKAHLRQSILTYEEALKVVTKNENKFFQSFHHILKTGHDRSLLQFSTLEEEDDFTELLAVPGIFSKTTVLIQPILPDFSKYKVEDVFQRLGCIAIFSAHHRWTAPRKIVLNKKPDEEFGFSIRGDSPVIVATVDNGSLAQSVGMLVGDFIVGVDETNIKWTKHEKVVSMIKSCCNSAIVHLVTPIDHNYIDPTQPPECSTFDHPPSSVPPTEEMKQECNMIKDRSSSLSWKLRHRP